MKAGLAIYRTICIINSITGLTIDVCVPYENKSGLYSIVFKFPECNKDITYTASQDFFTNELSVKIMVKSLLRTMKFAILGTRTFNDYELMKRSLADLTGVELVISGGAPGADTLAKRWANENGIEFIEFIADWDKYGKAAGPIRNEFIIKACTHVACFWDGKSPGSKNAIDLAKKHRKRYRIVNYKSS